MHIWLVFRHKKHFLGTQKNFYRNLILNLVPCQCHYKVSSSWGQGSRHVLTHSKVQVLLIQEMNILLLQVSVLIITAMFKRFYLEQFHVFICILNRIYFKDAVWYSRNYVSAVSNILLTVYRATVKKKFQLGEQPEESAIKVKNSL